MTKAQRDAQRLAYQALQEALDRRDNGGRTGALPEPYPRGDERDARDTSPRPSRPVR